MPTNTMTHEHLLASINRAQLAGFHGLANALLELYRREYPCTP